LRDETCGDDDTRQTRLGRDLGTRVASGYAGLTGDRGMAEEVYLEEDPEEGREEQSEEDKPGGTEAEGVGLAVHNGVGLVRMSICAGKG
jgi:hypothetical protein